MNNSVFEKTMENIRKHRNIKLVNNEVDYLRAVMQPNFKSGTLIGSDLMGCEMGKIKVVMNKLSKIVMYEFHYDYMKQKYSDNKLKLCYMDKDSLIYEIKTNNFYEDIDDEVESRFETSGYKDNDKHLPVGKNKKVIGLMKDKLGGDIMTEFITLRPKMYSYRVGKEELKKCKGIKKCVMWKTISLKDYKNCLLDGTKPCRSQLMFRSSSHRVRTLEVNKVVISRDDDKRITIDGIASFARGHWATREGPLSKKFNLYIK